MRPQPRDPCGRSDDRGDAPTPRSRVPAQRRDVGHAVGEVEDEVLVLAGIRSSPPRPPKTTSWPCLPSSRAIRKCESQVAVATGLIVSADHVGNRRREVEALDRYGLPLSPFRRRTRGCRRSRQRSCQNTRKTPRSAAVPKFRQRDASTEELSIPPGQSEDRGARPCVATLDGFEEKITILSSEFLLCLREVRLFGKRPIALGADAARFELQYVPSLELRDRREWRFQLGRCRCTDSGSRRTRPHSGRLLRMTHRKAEQGSDTGRERKPVANLDIIKRADTYTVSAQPKHARITVEERCSEVPLMRSSAAAMPYLRYVAMSWCASPVTDRPRVPRD